VRVIIYDDRNIPVGSFNPVQKTFKTGSTGFHATGKIELEQERFQVNILIVKIKSKRGD